MRNFPLIVLLAVGLLFVKKTIDKPAHASPIQPTYVSYPLAPERFEKTPISVLYDVPKQPAVPVNRTVYVQGRYGQNINGCYSTCQTNCGGGGDYLFDGNGWYPGKTFGWWLRNRPGLFFWRWR